MQTALYGVIIKYHKIKPKLIHHNWTEKQTDGKEVNRGNKKQRPTGSCTQKSHKNINLEAIKYTQMIYSFKREKKRICIHKIKKNNKIKI